MELYDLTRRALLGQTRAVELVRALANLDRVGAGRKGLSKRERQGVANAKRDARLAEQEVNDDFATLNAQLIVALWGYLEAYVEDLVADWVAQSHGATDTAEAQAVRVRLADFIRLDRQEWASLLVAEVANRANASDVGIGRLEALAKAFDLGGELEADLRKKLVEVGAIRNVLVHRGGRADRRFVDRCDWLGYRRGQLIKISSKAAMEYAVATINYAAELSRRRRRAETRLAEAVTGTTPPVVDA